MSAIAHPVALVTGSSRGIGLSIARNLASSGWAVIVHGSTESDALHAAFSEIKQLSPASRMAVADLADSDAIRGMFAGHDSLNALVNNAATQNPSPLVDLKEADIDRVLAVNLKAPLLCAQHAVRLMRRSPTGGKIINISSVHAFDAKRHYAHYSASKSGLEMLTRCMAMELAPYNIQVNSVVPGAIATEMTPADRQAKLLPAIPAGRIGDSEEVARLVSFLCSQECNYMTGASIVVDGGLTLGFCASRPDL